MSERKPTKKRALIFFAICALLVIAITIYTFTIGDSNIFTLFSTPILYSIMLITAFLIAINRVELLRTFNDSIIFIIYSIGITLAAIGKCVDFFEKTEQAAKNDFHWWMSIPMLLWVLLFGINIFQAMKGIRKYSVGAFVGSYLCAAVSFLNVYCYIFAANPSSFCGVDVSNAYTVFTDLALFTVQIFSVQTIVEIVPCSVASKLICMIEMLFFAFFVTITLISFLGTAKTDSKEK